MVTTITDLPEEIGGWIRPRRVNSDGWVFTGRAVDSFGNMQTQYTDPKQLTDRQLHRWTEPAFEITSGSDKINDWWIWFGNGPIDMQHEIWWNGLGIVRRYAIDIEEALMNIMNHEEEIWDDRSFYSNSNGGPSWIVRELGEAKTRLESSLNVLRSIAAADLVVEVHSDAIRI